MGVAFLLRSKKKGWEYAMRKFKTGDTAYLVESNRIVRPGKILNVSGDMCLFRFEDGGGIRVRQSRLFPSFDDASESMRGKSKSKNNNNIL